eukprot:TRINITY_DN77732_c0_g1_i1.p1 TRINITY_DN77732_c0_g1~~TRINITY_DN77732_c0_g1_i1.p1  ORF type:complete len:357 (+),score=60.00 TRINITY_DN77732_c0_g1_i1:32-1102(+)
MAMKKSLVGSIKSQIERRLFVGRLTSTTKEEDLRQAFGQYGAITDVRLLTEKGVAFVTFERWTSAQKALQAMDGNSTLPSSPQPMAVYFAEKSGSRGDKSYAKGCDNSRIFVGSLPEGFTDELLKQTFGGFGTVQAANMLPPKGSTSRRCGFVNFDLWGEAMDAIEAMDGRPLPGTLDSEPISVVLADPRERETQYSGLKRGRTESHDNSFESLKAAYIRAVDSDATAAECDEIHRRIMAARQAWFSTHRWDTGGRAPIKRPSLSEGSRDEGRLFVGGLPYDCGDEELRQLVDQVPLDLPASQRRITECRVLSNKGCGYLSFASLEAATLALEALNDREVRSWPQPLRVKWATPKG